MRYCLIAVILLAGCAKLEPRLFVSGLLPGRAKPEPRAFVCDLREVPERAVLLDLEPGDHISLAGVIAEVDVEAMTVVYRESVFVRMQFNKREAKNVVNLKPGDLAAISGDVKRRDGPVIWLENCWIGKNYGKAP
jgi:hypothetical protein